MDEYIDRDALLARLDGIWDCSDIVFPNGRDHICKVPEECKGCKWRDVLAAFKEMVKHATAADVEPVVRCRDCTKFHVAGLYNCSFAKCQGETLILLTIAAGERCIPTAARRWTGRGRTLCHDK